MNLKKVLTVCGILAMGAIPSFATLAVLPSIAYIGVPGQGNQPWQGALGMDFTVSSTISVDYMGVYNSNGTSTLTAPLSVEIFNVGTGAPVAGTAFTFQPTTLYTQLSGDLSDLFEQISPVTLSPGTIYSVVAVGFGYGNQLNGNSGFGNPWVGATEGGSPAINYVGGARYTYNSSLVLPEITDGGPTNRYDAGTFAFTPEPGFYGVLALGLTGLLAAVRRRKSV